MRTMHALLLGSFVATAILGLQGTAVAQGQHFGGYGGVQHGSRQCPDYVIGIHGYIGAGGEGGTVVTQLGFTCADRNLHELGTFGPPKGTYFQIDCNSGDAANGVEGRSGKYLDAIGLLCRDPSSNAYTARVTMGPFSSMAGGDGGNPFRFICGSQGEIPLQGLNIWTGDNIDGFDPVCNATIRIPTVTPTLTPKVTPTPGSESATPTVTPKATPTPVSQSANRDRFQGKWSVWFTVGGVTAIAALLGAIATLIRALRR